MFLEGIHSARHIFGLPNILNGNCIKHLYNNNIENFNISFCIFFTADSVQGTVSGVYNT
jgi:hypothetical protein